MYEHGQKLLDLALECGHDFGDVQLMRLPDPPPTSDFDSDGRYHAIRTDDWGTTWEYRIFGIWGHPIGWPLNDLFALDNWQAPEPPPTAGIEDQVTNTDLSYIMHRARAKNAFGEFRGQPHAAGNLSSEVTDSPYVCAGVFIAKLRSTGQEIDCLIVAII
jgi:hypothetical protein